MTTIIFAFFPLFSDFSQFDATRILIWSIRTFSIIVDMKYDYIFNDYRLDTYENTFESLREIHNEVSEESP